MKLFKKRSVDPIKDNKDYPGFTFQSTELVRYLQSGYVFTLLLNNGNVAHFEPKDPVSFDLWLRNNAVPSVLDVPSDSPHRRQAQ